MKRFNSYTEAEPRLKADMAQAIENVTIAAWGAKLVCQDVGLNYHDGSTLASFARTILEERDRLERDARHA